MSTSPDSSNAVYTDLLPVLIQCVTIILLGYLSGRLKLIGPTEATGLKVFVTSFALPAIAFKSLATLKLGSVNWKFLASVFLTKTTVFIAAALLTLLLSRRPTAYAKAGLYAIASSQSNDFALGYPLISDLYSRTHPTFCHYLYLIAPIQLVLLNPIGFALMEYGTQGPAQALLRKVFTSVAGIFKNPIVFMPVIGVLWNLATSGSQLPNVCAGIVDSLGDAFSASALFLFGLHMVGQLSSMEKYAALTPFLIVTAKILVSPLLLRQIVNLLDVGSTAAETKAFGSFGFLYGMLPTAPSVFVFAAQYELPTAVVSTSMVTGTLLSAPFIFISATMAQLSGSSLDDFLSTMGTTVVYTGAISTVCSLWVLFVLSQKISSVTHGATFCLVLSQLVTAVGGILWAAVDADSTAVCVLQSVLSLSGIFASRVWTALLATLLAMLHWRSLCFVLRIRWILILLGFGASAAVACVMCLSVSHHVSHFGKVDPNFHFGRLQANVAAGVLTVTLVVTVASLVIQQRSRIGTRGYAPLSGSDDDDEDAERTGAAPVNRGSLPYDGSQSPASRSPRASDSNVDGCTGDCETCDNCSRDEESQPDVPDLEDIFRASKRRRYDPSRFHKARTQKSAKQLSINRADWDASPVPSTSTARPEDQLCGPEFNCDQDRVKECLAAIEAYADRVASDEDGVLVDEERDASSADDDHDPHQIFRHVVLLVLSCASMVVGLAVSLWRPLSGAPTGILVELEFVDILLNYGQGVLSFAVFGLDPTHVVRPFRALGRTATRRIADLARTVGIPSEGEISAQAGKTCRQFETYHYASCPAQIATPRTIADAPEGGRAFLGKDLVDWLLAVGLCHDRTRAERYGRDLLDGGIIRHVGSGRHLEDGGRAYVFVPTRQRGSGEPVE